MKIQKLIVIISLLLSSAAYVVGNDQMEMLQTQIKSDPAILAALLLHLAKNMPQIISKAAKNGKIVDLLRKFVALELSAERCLEQHKLEKTKCEFLKKALVLFRKIRSRAMEELDENKEQTDPPAPNDITRDEHLKLGMVA